MENVHFERISKASQEFFFDLKVMDWRLQENSKEASKEIQQLKEHLQEFQQNGKVLRIVDSIKNLHKIVQSSADIVKATLLYPQLDTRRTELVSSCFNLISYLKEKIWLSRTRIEIQSRPFAARRNTPYIYMPSEAILNQISTNPTGQVLMRDMSVTNPQNNQEEEELDFLIQILNTELSKEREIFQEESKSVPELKSAKKFNPSISFSDFELLRNTSDPLQKNLETFPTWPDMPIRSLKRAESGQNIRPQGRIWSSEERLLGSIFRELIQSVYFRKIQSIMLEYFQKYDSLWRTALSDEKKRIKVLRNFFVPYYCDWAFKNAHVWGVIDKSGEVLALAVISPPGEKIDFGLKVLSASSLSLQIGVKPFSLFRKFLKKQEKMQEQIMKGSPHWRILTPYPTCLTSDLRDKIFDLIIRWADNQKAAIYLEVFEPHHKNPLLMKGFVGTDMKCKVSNESDLVFYPLVRWPNT